MSTDADSRESIAVIGGGPGAMFFCHAIEVQRNELLKKGEDVSHFPIVKCFERAPGPGGVWRSDRSHEDDHDGREAGFANPKGYSFCEEKKEEDILQAAATPNMYSALWTNGAKEAYEFYDYTFRDHFGNVRMPSYLPRQHVLDYMLARCTRNCPNFFDKYFSLRTSVVNVKYLENEKCDSDSPHHTSNKFRVHTRNENTGLEVIETFDKCVWAGGMNGIPFMPKKLVKLFKNGGFKGSIVHSSDTTNFKSDVENKRVLIVGGGLSAEDLTLMAIKEGASRIYCTFRGDTAKEMAWTTRWPYDKVEILTETTITKVEGNTIALREVLRDYCEGEYELVEDGDETILNDIDTVIFCTGYEPNLSMLDQLFRDVLGDAEVGVTMPKGWTMNKNAAVDAILGEDHKQVKPSKAVYPVDDFANCWYDLYRGCILIDNPNMMYFMNDFSNTPLMEAEVTSWMLAKYVTGQKALPSRKEMDEDNYKVTLDCMQNCKLRFQMDERFNRKLKKIVGPAFENWSEEREKLWEAEEDAAEEYQYRLLGKMMDDAEYPVRFLSEDGNSFSEYANKIIHMEKLDPRNKMHTFKDNIGEDRETVGADWMTFRDAPSVEKHVSCFTGIKACRLPKPWFELNEDDKLW